MTYYRRHVFVCENVRDNGECCAKRPHASGAVKFLRNILKEHDLHRAGGVRVNRAGCFNRCALGPVLVVYPEGVWYRYDGEKDLRKIAQSHLMDGVAVTRLRLADTATS